MKKSRKKLLGKLMLAILFIAVFIFSCEKENFDDIEIDNTSKSLYTQRSVRLSEIYEINDYLDKVSNGDLFSKNNQSQAIFDVDNVLEVIDTLNNTNYSLRFVFADSPAGEFYNLIVGKDADGNLKTPFVYRYRVDDAALGNYIKSGFSFRSFKGTIDRHRYTDFFSLGYFGKSVNECPTEYDANGDPIPCVRNNVGVNGDTTGGGNGDVGGDNGTGTDTNFDGSGNEGSQSCGIIAAYLTCGCGGNADGHLGTGWHGGHCVCYGSPLVIMNSCTGEIISTTWPSSNKAAQSTIDCPDCNTGTSGGIGINTPSVEDAKADLKNILKPLSATQFEWMNDDTNTNEVLALYEYLYMKRHPDGYFTNETINLVKSTIDIISDPLLPPNLSYLNYTQKIEKMINHLRQFGDPEDEFFADYLEALIPDFINMTVGDVYNLYKITRTQTHELTKKYLKAIVVPFAEAAYPFVIFALTEATLGAALPLLSRIPIAMVSRGHRLEKMVREIAKLGTAGTGSHIRLIPNSSYVKASSLFNKITQNAVSITTETLSNGRIRKVADMSNGNYITFRNYDYSNTHNLVANIDLNFPSIWSKIRELKFIQ